MAIGSKITKLFDYLFRLLFKFLFRYDIFISYARRDGKAYALKLKDQLTKLDFSCFLDYEELPVGNSLNKTLKQAIRKSATLVVIGTERAVKSPYVELEISEFTQTGRAIIPIDIEGSLANPPWPVIKERDIVWIDETKDALAKEAPSPIVADSIDKLFKYTRRNTRIRGQVLLTALLFSVVVLVSGLMIQSKVKAYNLASATAQRNEETAKAAGEEAEKQKVEAERQKAEAEVQKAEANTQKHNADIATDNAKKQEAKAIASEKRARLQQLIAEDKTRTARSQEIAAQAKSQLQVDPAQSLILSGNAMDAKYTAEAEDAMRHSLSESHVRATLTNHKQVVNDIRYSPDGKHLVTFSLDGTVRLWEAGRENPVAEMKHAPNHNIFRASFSPNSQMVVTASEDKTARVWDANTGDIVSTLKHDGLVPSASFSPDSKLVVTVSWDKTARVWDARTGNPALEKPLSHPDVVIDAAFSNDGRYIFTASRDASIRTWDAKTGALISEKAYRGGIMLSGISFSPNRSLAVLNYLMENFLQVVELSTGKILATMYGHLSIINSVAFSRDGLQIVTASDDHTALIWKLSDLYELVRSRTALGEKLPVAWTNAVILRGHTSSLTSATFSPDGRFVVTTSGDTTVREWNARTGEEVSILRGHSDKVNRAEFSPDGKSIASGSWDRTARIWESGVAPDSIDLASYFRKVGRKAINSSVNLVVSGLEGKTAWAWESAAENRLADSPGNGSLPKGSDVSRDGKYIVTASHNKFLSPPGTNAEDSSARVWEVKSGKLFVELHANAKGVRDVRFSPDGKSILTVGHDETACVWNAITGARISDLCDHTSGISSAEFSFDGEFIVTTGFDKSVRVWHWKTGEERARLSDDPDFPTSATFSPDGNIVSIVDDRRLDPKMWRWKHDKSTIDLKGHRGGGVARVLFSPDSKLVATAAMDNSARVYEARTGKLVFELRGHTSPVVSLAFSPDGKFLATGSDGLSLYESASRSSKDGDSTARIWETDTGHLLTTIQPDIGGVYAVRFSPDGKFIVAAGTNNKLMVYPCEICSSASELRYAVKERTGKRQ